MQDNKLTELLQIISQSLKEGTCRKIVLCEREASAPDQPEQISIHPFQKNGEVLYQWSKKIGRQELHENLSAGKTVALLRPILESVYKKVSVLNLDKHYEFQLQKNGHWKMKQKAITKPALEIAEHNKSRNYLIPESRPCPFLIETGVMNQHGKVIQSKYAKFRQINRFLELVADVLPLLKSEGALRVIDYGCGKSYLTFALEYFFHEIHKRQAKMTGLDLRDDVIHECQRICRVLGLKDLAFEKSAIAEYKQHEKVDLAVSLHACDTATDDALIQAVNWDSQVILAVPCCQHEFLHQKLKVTGLEGLQQHGILQERFCAMATDSYRAMCLEALGYQTQIIEFIDMEHTPKNIMIRGHKREIFSSESRSLKLNQLESFRSVLNLPHNRLGDFACSKAK